MNIFRRLSISLFLGILLSVPAVTVLAVDVLDPVCENNPTAAACVDSQETQSQDCNSLFGACGILTKVTRVVLTIVGVAAIIMIIIGSIQYIISSGDPTNVTNAKNTILYAIIGLVIALIAQGIILFVLNQL